MSPALNGSSAIQCFERGDAIEICDGITFDFYTGLSHIYIGLGLGLGLVGGWTKSNSARSIQCQSCTSHLISVQQQLGNLALAPNKSFTDHIYYADEQHWHKLLTAIIE